jgi:hypothetical protein
VLPASVWLNCDAMKIAAANYIHRLRRATAADDTPPL